MRARPVAGPRNAYSARAQPSLRNNTMWQDGRFLPFTCPMDHVLSPYDWEQAGMQWRDAAFLESERLPKAARASMLRGGGEDLSIWAEFGLHM